VSCFHTPLQQKTPLYLTESYCVLIKIARAPLGSTVVGCSKDDTMKGLHLLWHIISMPCIRYKDFESLIWIGATATFLYLRSTSADTNRVGFED
jgi:hypothetical protein